MGVAYLAKLESSTTPPARKQVGKMHSNGADQRHGEDPLLSVSKQR